MRQRKGAGYPLNQELLAMLKRVTPEEERILSEGAGIEQSFYTSSSDFVVEPDKLLESGQLITVRTHTRFVDFPEHGHNYMEMMYVCQGVIVHIINGAQVVMEQGDILLLSQNARHAVRAATADDIGINLIILPQFFDTALRMLGAGNILADFLIALLHNESGGDQYLHFRLGDNLQTSNLMENLVFSLVHRQPDSQDINRHLMGLLFLYLLKNAKSLSQDAPNNYEDVVIHALKRYLDAHYATATLMEFAQSMHHSLTGLSLLIKRKTGSTFKELLQHKRFEAAMTLLCDTQLSVVDIVHMVGYQNNSYFHRRFREKYGMSPTEYRRKHANQKAFRV